MSSKITHKIYARRIYNGRGDGYAKDGTYYGLGAPVYRVSVLAQVSAPDDLEPWEKQVWNEPYCAEVRAYERDDAIWFCANDNMNRIATSIARFDMAFCAKLKSYTKQQA